MKKILLLIVFTSVILLSGCSNYNESSIKKDLNKSINSIKGYHLLGELDIYNGDNTYRYKVEVSNSKDNYRVCLINKNNNHEQIIIRNDDGVYVLNPSLNKSYKFQSNWPENSSQVYLLESLLTDINNDKQFKLIKKDNNYVLETQIAYSNNKNMFKEKIYLDKNLNFKRVEVYDEDNNIQMKMIFTEVDKKATFNDSYFDVKENMKSEEETKETMNKIDDTIYPMYLPSGTYLSGEENVSKENGERVILTFAGESPFILVQETIGTDEESIPVMGEPTFVSDTVGALSSNSLTFMSNGIEYYLSSDNLTKQEMMQIAESISPVAVMK